MTACSFEHNVIATLLVFHQFEDAIETTKQEFAYIALFVHGMQCFVEPCGERSITFDGLDNFTFDFLKRQ